MKWTLLAIGVPALACVEFFLGATGCGRVPVRVYGVVTDAAGAPIEGASLLTLFVPDEARDPEGLELRRDLANRYAERSREDLVRWAPGVGSARTDASGAFEIIVGVSTSSYRGPLTGIRWSRNRGSAFRVAAALLVEKEGYVQLVHETKDARWIEQREGEIVGTLEVGTIWLGRR